MNHLNRRHFFWLIVSFSAAVYFLLLLAFPVEGNKLSGYLRLLPLVVTVDVIFSFIFSGFLWKWKIFYPWLVPFPNLNGTWKGSIRSEWVDPKSKKNPPLIPVILTIKQTFTTISCVMRTEEMESYSFNAGFVIDQDNQILKLVYSYDSIPNQSIKDRSPQHQGSINFNISFLPQMELNGEYWTARKTTGTIKLEYWKGELYDKYPDELRSHKVSK